MFVVFVAHVISLFAEMNTFRSRLLVGSVMSCQSMANRQVYHYISARLQFASGVVFTSGHRVGLTPDVTVVEAARHQTGLYLNKVVRNVRLCIVMV